MTFLETDLDDRNFYLVFALQLCKKLIGIANTYKSFHMTVIYLHWKQYLLIIKHTWKL